MFYYFEHSAVGHMMVISDDSCDSVFCPPHAAHAEVKFNAGNRAQHEDCVTALSARRQLHSSRLTLNTYDFKAPYGQRMIEIDTVAQQGEVPCLEVYDGNPAFAFKNRAKGERLARLRMELIEWQGKLFYGESDCRAFTAGHTCKLLEHHWFEQQNQGDNDFLLIEVKYEARNNYLARGAASVYRNTFTAIRRKIPYRPPARHPAPRMSGPQIATVVGPKGGEIYTDEHGRIKVQFPWDRHGKHDENSSTWLRLSQAFAGQGWGMIAIPRVGQEVLVDFLEGNCSRPVVTGRLFNADQPVPYKLPGDAHITGFKSRSTPGGGGYSEIAIHDAKSKELLNIRAQKDMTTTVLGCMATVVHGEKLSIQVANGSQLTSVKRNVDLQAHTGHIHLTAQTDITLEVGASMLKLRADGIIEVRGRFQTAGPQRPRTEAGKTASPKNAAGHKAPLPNSTLQVDKNRADVFLMASTCSTREACDALSSQLANTADYLTRQAAAASARGDSDEARKYLRMAADDRTASGHAYAKFHPATVPAGSKGGPAMPKCGPLDTAHGQHRASTDVYGNVYYPGVAYVPPGAVSVWSDPLMHADECTKDYIDAYNHHEERKFNIVTAGGSVVGAAAKGVGLAGTLFKASEAGPAFLFGLTNTVEREAALIIDAKAGKATVAVARAGRISEGTQTESFTNLPVSIKDFTRNGGVEMVGNSTFKVVDSEAFITHLTDAYAERGLVMHPTTQAWIRTYIADSRVIDTFAGVPGAHAEVLAVNEVLSQATVAPELSDIAVATFKTVKGKGVGAPFAACTNCSGILPNLILTGRKQ